MFKKLLTSLKKAKDTSASLVQVQDLLYRSRVYEFLREVGRPKDVHPSTPNYLEVQAMQTAWSVGYNQCLDHIMMFREVFIEADLEKTPPKMSFGGLDLALSKEDLTKEEADAIRSGKPVPRTNTKRRSSKTTKR